MIPLAAEASRIIRGVRVEHVCGDPNLSEENDARLAQRIVGMAMTALQTDVDSPTVFDLADESNAETVSAS